jgi:hypothetical protein
MHIANITATRFISVRADVPGSLRTGECAAGLGSYSFNAEPGLAARPTLL